MKKITTNGSTTNGSTTNARREPMETESTRDSHEPKKQNNHKRTGTDKGNTITGKERRTNKDEKEESVMTSLVLK